MTQEETIPYLAEGHSLWTVEKAREICQAFELELPDELIIRWKNQKEANPTNDPKGLWLDEPDKPGEGVGSIELSQYVTNQLKLERSSYYGRGSQARSNAAAIRTFLERTKAATQ